MTYWAYDPVSRLASMTHDLGGTANDLTQTFSYNPAHQISQVVRSNDAYAWTGHGSGSTASTANGLNQLATISGASTTHDARGNLTSDPTRSQTYAYTSENQLKSASGGISAYYDPLGRLTEYNTNVSRRFMSDGLQIAVEIDNPAGAVQRRFVWGDGSDELIVEYSGSGTSNRRWAHADERGSVIAYSDAAGAASINKYDEFGRPQPGNTGVFQYTGQMWLSELGQYNYKARNYAPHLGRFMQTDPIGYAAGPNLYAYVGNDPVNFTDPLGLCSPRITETTVFWTDNNRDGVRGPGEELYRTTSVTGPGSPCPTGDMTGFGMGSGRSVRNERSVQVPEKKLDDCVKSFLRRELAARGYPTAHLDDVRFVGAMTGVGLPTTLARWGGYPAITRGNNIYVHPNRFGAFSSPGDVFFSEIVHTAQYAAGDLSTGQRLRGGRGIHIRVGKQGKHFGGIRPPAWLRACAKVERCRRLQTMQKMKLWLVLSAALLVPSCNEPETYDPFFKREYEEWVPSARKLETVRVYELYKKQLKMPPPTDPSLSIVLGERGKEAVDLMLADLNGGDKTILPGYYPLLAQVWNRSRFNFCTTGDYYYQINRALERGFGLKFPESTKYVGGQSTAFDRLCQMIQN